MFQPDCLNLNVSAPDVLPDKFGCDFGGGSFYLKKTQTKTKQN